MQIARHSTHHRSTFTYLEDLSTGHMNIASFETGTVLLVDGLNRKEARLFTSPSRILTCNRLADVQDFLSTLQALQESGKHLAGFLAYELGYAFEPKLCSHDQEKEQLLGWFGVYEAPEIISLTALQASLEESTGSEPAVLSALRFEWPQEQYSDAFDTVREHLAKGDIYQVNLTMRAHFDHYGAPEKLFSKLLVQQPVAHAALLKLGDRSILSLSPELFMERQGQMLRTRPMKGTSPRGMTPDEDNALAQQLAGDKKQRAENTMIVDLMRNDMSRIAEPGTVTVTKLCSVERYRSLHQMTSTIEGQLRPGVGFAQAICNLFPCGSITGAPKLSAMSIAKRLETSPRGVYTGSIGALEPSGDFRFNVAIRTLVLWQDGSGDVGTGSGLVFDSKAVSEYAECRLKLRFAMEQEGRFDLLETLAYFPEEGYLLLDRHMGRLRASADYFGYSFNQEALLGALRKRASLYQTPKKVRVLVSETGVIQISETDLELAGPRWKVVLADEVCDPSDRFLYHKTTNRCFYDMARRKYAQRTGCQEVIFLNKHGYLTEGSFTNLFLRLDGLFKTPALRHGLLPGTLRQSLLETGRAEEADLTVHDLYEAAEIFVGNSVRGLIPVDLIDPERCFRRSTDPGDNGELRP